MLGIGGLLFGVDGVGEGTEDALRGLCQGFSSRSMYGRRVGSMLGLGIGWVG